VVRIVLLSVIVFNLLIRSFNKYGKTIKNYNTKSIQIINYESFKSFGYHFTGNFQFPGSKRTSKTSPQKASQSG
jgi:hypothetical protein